MKADEPPAPKDPGKAALRARLDALADKIDPESEEEREAKYSARARRNREAAGRLAAGNQQPPKTSSTPARKAAPRRRASGRPVRRDAGTDAEGPARTSERLAGAECLAALAHATWAAGHDVAECPPDHIPTPHDMAGWWPWPENLIEGLSAWLTERAGPDPLTFEAVVPEFKTGSDEPLMHVDVAALRKQLPDADLDRLHLVTRYGPLPLRAAMEAAGRIGLTFLSVTDLGLLIGVLDRLADSSSILHPLAPLVHAWQRRTTHREARALVNRASLPRFAKVGTGEATLPDFPENGPPPPADGQLLLPGFGDAVRGCASWLLWLFDQAGGDGKPGPGRGARWDLRLFVYALLHLDVADRDGEWHTIRLPAAPEHAARIYETTGKRLPSVEDWLHPNGWANKRRDWHKLPAALDRMRRLAYVPVLGIGRVAVLFPSVIPSAPSDSLIEWTIRIPRVAAHGDRLNWPRLLDYGAESDRLFRAYLAVAAWLGRSANHGHPITRQIAAPVLGPGGKPRRRKGGAIIRSATERTDNPARRYVGPPLSQADLTRMIGFNPTDKRRRYDARAAIERMEADGVIEIGRSGTGWLLFGGPDY